MACMSFFGCHSGLFSAARRGAAADQPEERGESPGLACCGAVQQQQPPLAGPGEIAQGVADEDVQARAPAAPAPSKASDVAGRCFPAARRSRAGEPEAAPSPADESEESPAQPADQAAPSAAAEASPEEPAQEYSSWGAPQIQMLQEPEPAALHFEGSDPEDAAAGKAARGCCVPRASRRRTRATNKVARHEEQQVTATASSVKAEGGAEAKQQEAGEGKRGGKSRASAGA